MLEEEAWGSVSVPVHVGVMGRCLHTFGLAVSVLLVNIVYI